MTPDLERDAYGLVRMSDDQCWAFLDVHHLGRLAVVDQGQPMVFPVNYALDGRSVVFRTSPGTKLTAAALGRDAVFEVDEASELFETGASVMVHGTVREVTDRDERQRLQRLPLRTWAPGGRDHLVRVEPRWLSGRRIPLQGRGDGLHADAG